MMNLQNVGFNSNADSSFIVYNLSLPKNSITKKLHRTDSPPQYADVIGQTKKISAKKI